MKTRIYIQISPQGTINGHNFLGNEISLSKSEERMSFGGINVFTAQVSVLYQVHVSPCF